MKKNSLWFLLAVLGFVVGTHLDRLLAPRPTPMMRVGQNIVGARYCPDTGLIAGVGPSRSDKWALEVWTREGKMLTRVEGIPVPPGRYPALVWLADGRNVAVAAGKEVWLVSADSGRKHILRAGDTVRQLDQASGVLMARCNGEIDIWEKPANGKRWALKADHLIQTALDPSGKFLAICCFQDGLRLFHLPSKRQFQHLDPGIMVTSPVFSRGGDYLSYGIRQRNRTLDRVFTYCLSKNKPVGQPLVTPELQGLAVDSAGKYLVASGKSQTVWELEKGSGVAEAPFRARLLSSISSDGNWTLSAPGNQMSAVLWKTTDPQTQFTLEQTDKSSDLSFANESNFLTVSAGIATLWSVP